MANVGELTFTLSIDTGTFDTDVEAAKTKMGQLATAEDGAASSGEGIGTAAGNAKDKIISALGGAAVVAAIGKITSAFIEAVNAAAQLGDNIDKMSMRLGMSTTEYQAWSSVFGHAGLDLDSSMRAFNSFFDSVTGGSEDGAAALQALGLSAEDLSTMSNSDRMMAVISAFQSNNAENGGTMDTDTLTGYAKDIFGDTQGMNLLSLLLSSGVAEQYQMGTDIAASEESTSSAAKFKDAVQNFNDTIASLSLDALAPALELFASALSTFTDWLLVLTGKKSYDTDAEYAADTEGDTELTYSGTEAKARQYKSEAGANVDEETASQEGYGEVESQIARFLAALQGSTVDADTSFLQDALTNGFDMSTIGAQIAEQYGNINWYDNVGNSTDFESNMDAKSALGDLTSKIQKFSPTVDITATLNGHDVGVAVATEVHGNGE